MPAIYCDTKIIYGISYGMCYYCKPCNAYVGVHKGTNKPKGTLANEKLRKLRKQCHDKFDPYWKNGKIKRASAYKRLSRALCIDAKNCHIGMFDEETCVKMLALFKRKIEVE